MKSVLNADVKTEFWGEILMKLNSEPLHLPLTWTRSSRGRQVLRKYFKTFWQTKQSNKRKNDEWLAWFTSTISRALSVQRPAWSRLSLITLSLRKGNLARSHIYIYILFLTNPFFFQLPHCNSQEVLFTLQTDTITSNSIAVWQVPLDSADCIH